MNRQWAGNFEGTSSGHITLNLESNKAGYFGQAIVIDDNPEHPSFTARVFLKTNDGIIFEGALENFLFINPITLLPEPWERLKAFFKPSIIVPVSGNITGHLESNNRLKGKWSTNINTQGNFILKKSAADQPSLYPSTTIKWEQFKEFTDEYIQKKYIFRGQPGTWRLRTTYHRTGSSDFALYTQNIPELHRQVCAQTNRLFRLNDPTEYGALLALAQHHGYPTPLLDWTFSPYIAAYFAFSLLTEDHEDNKVRIYLFDCDTWCRNTRPVAHLDSPLLSITPLTPVPLHNPRATPQQSVLTFSNVDDMETFIGERAFQDRIQYLTVVEMRANEKKTVLRDLAYMGVHAGSLFPGLDGICRMLKERHF